MKKEKNWFIRHWFISIILVIILIGIISGIANGGKDVKISEKKEKEENIQKINVMEKTSGFTMDDCYEICDKYPMQINTDVCYGGCNMFGKPSSKLDEFCLRSIQSVKNSQ
jgi:hypothetical protein